MDAVEQFFAMGGHGGYVWPAYAIAAAILLALWFGSLRSVRHREAELAALRESRRRAGGMDE